MSLLIVHEQLHDEASHVQHILKTFGVQATIAERDLTSAFIPREQGGFLRKSASDHKQAVRSSRAIVLTPRDIFASDHPDSWVLGYNRGELFVAVTARLKGKFYLDRIAFVVLHEMAHEAVKSRHLKEAVWMGQGFQQKLGKHCTDAKCTLYEIVDLQTPTDGYMLLGREQRFDVGLDGLMARRYKEFFCKRCLPQVKKYLATLSQ